MSKILETLDRELQKQDALTAEERLVEQSLGRWRIPSAKGSVQLGYRSAYGCSSQVLAEIVKGVRLSKDTVAKLRDLQSQFDRFWAAFNQTANEPVEKAHRDHIHDLQVKVMGGEALEGMDGWSPNELRSDRDTKLDALRGLLVDISMQAWHVLKPHFSAAAEAGEALLRQEIRDELARCARWGHPGPDAPHEPARSIAEGIGQFRQAAADAPVGMVPPRRQCKPFLDL